MQSALNGWSRKAESVVTSSITVGLKRSGKLHIEMNNGGLLRLSYLECSQISKPRGTEVIRSSTLKDALPFFDFLGMVIPTRLGNLVVNDSKEVRQLRIWLKGFSK